MSREYDNLLKEVLKQGKQVSTLDSHLNKDILEIKKTLKNIENRTKSVDNKVSQILEILNTLTIFIASDDDMDFDAPREQEEWNPYESYTEDYEYSDNEDDDDTNQLDLDV